MNAAGDAWSLEPKLGGWATSHGGLKRAESDDQINLLQCHRGRVKARCSMIHFLQDHKQNKILLTTKDMEHQLIHILWQNDDWLATAPLAEALV